ncbi:serine/threonine protein kinase, partial [Paenibacillus riograndensis]
MVKEDTHIALTVSTAKPLSKMIPLAGKTLEEATKLLIAEGVDQSRITPDQRYSEDFPEGQVIGTEPAVDSEYDPATATVKLIVSQGKETADVPDLTNKPQAEAKSLLEAAGLVLGEVKEESSFSVEKGIVME